VKYNKICIVGLGLLGGSIGLTLTKRKLAKEVFGVARKQETINEALKNGVIDKGSVDIKDGIQDAEIIIFALPVETIIENFKILKSYNLKNVIVTDVGSTKVNIVKNAKILGKAFVGSHPMAGSEKNGVTHAQENLFQDKVCFVTPTKKCSEKNVVKIKEFWQDLGLKSVEIDPETHDKAVAFVSHLPHALAAVLVNSVDEKLIASTAGSGFFDTTRVASGLPLIWKEIFLSNNKIKRCAGITGVFREGKKSERIVIARNHR